MEPGSAGRQQDLQASIDLRIRIPRSRTTVASH